MCVHSHRIYLHGGCVYAATPLTFYISTLYVCFFRLGMEPVVERTLGLSAFNCFPYNSPFVCPQSLSNKFLNYKIGIHFVCLPVDGWWSPPRSILLGDSCVCRDLVFFRKFAIQIMFQWERGGRIGIERERERVVISLSFEINYTQRWDMRRKSSTDFTPCRWFKFLSSISKRKKGFFWMLEASQVRNQQLEWVVYVITKGKRVSLW